VLERDGDLQFGGTGTLVVLFVQRDAGLPCGGYSVRLGGGGARGAQLDTNRDAGRRRDGKHSSARDICDLELRSTTMEAMGSLRRTAIWTSPHR
jgi:hypothetical protein